MGKTERLIAAAAIAFALSAEAGCDSGNATIQCTVVDPAHARTHQVTVSADATCPPSSTVGTSARGATHTSSGWYYTGGHAYYGVLPLRHARPATAEEAQRLESSELSREQSASHANESAQTASRGGSEEGGGHGGFGESGAHGGFGG